MCRDKYLAAMGQSLSFGSDTLTDYKLISFPVAYCRVRESARCYTQFVCYMYRVKFLQEVPCELRQQFSGAWKVFKQLIPFYIVRKYIEDKCILHPFKITVLHTVCDTDSEAGLSVVSWYLLVVYTQYCELVPSCCA